MRKRKILFIFGTRPEAIKMAPLVLELKKDPAFLVRVAVTAQHREMLDSVLRLFRIRPDHDLNIMKKDQDLYSITTQALLGLRDVIRKEKPDCILVHGDTSTTFAGALAGFYEKTAVGHIEAGLRTFDKYAPWPEEMNRKLTTALTDYYFIPTETGKRNLRKENVPSEKLYVTGNTVIDALILMKRKIKKKPSLKRSILRSLSSFLPGTVAGLNSSCRKMILITGHRRENFGTGFVNICKALAQIARTWPEIDLVYPVHLNPNVRKPVYSHLKDLKNIYLIPPVQYPEFVYLMMNSCLIITDSGGVQEEAPSLGKPVLVMREVTERPEAVRAGTVKLVGTDPDKIFRSTKKLLTDSLFYRKVSGRINPYGDGKACQRIKKVLKKVIRT